MRGPFLPARPGAMWIAALLLLAGMVGRAAADRPADSTDAAPKVPVRRQLPPRDPRDFEEQLFLTWNAPYGSPRASDRVITSCDDTTRVDTLYLSFRPGEDIIAPVAMEAVVFFSPAPGDTLGEFWQFKRGWPNQLNMRIDFDYAAGFPCALPWRKTGFGRVSYDHRSGRGRLDLSFKVDPEYGSIVQKSEFRCVARVAIRSRRPDLSGCGQPVAVEWASMRIRSVQGYDVEIARGMKRFVSWNDPDGVALATIRETPRVPAWRPPVKTGDTPATFEYRPTRLHPIGAPRDTVPTEPPAQP